MLLLLVGSALVAILLLNQVGKRARQAGLSPASWSLGVLMVWGFLWVGGKELGQYLDRIESPVYARISMLVGTLLLGLLAYWLTLRRLKLLGGKREMDDLLEEIGGKGT